MLQSLHGALTQRGIDPEILRGKFSEYKAGDEHRHFWFCHDIGPNLGDELRHVHMFPSQRSDLDRWTEKYNSRGLRKTRTSDRYLLYAHEERHGYLIIDVLDDPGAHDLWKQRRTNLKGYEQTAWEFAVNGTKNLTSC